MARRIGGRTVVSKVKTVGEVPVATEVTAAEALPDSFAGRGLLKKKQRDLLVPVTFRMPQSLKERLEQTARQHEVNQTDLINEAIDLNLQRYS